jgi:hypothetical protein
MIGLKASEIRAVMNDLPAPHHVECEHVRLFVRDPYWYCNEPTELKDNSVSRIVEFKKTPDGSDWVLIDGP